MKAEKETKSAVKKEGKKEKKEHKEDKKLSDDLLLASKESSELKSKL